MSISSQELVHFNNGLKLIFQSNESVPVVTTQAWVNVGSADESISELGMAHVLEHMLFKGTSKYPGEKIAKLIEGRGGEINAFTSYDQTVYHLTIASRYLHLGIDIISEMIQNPIIDNASLESEKEVIIEEIKRSSDSPGREVSKVLFETIFSGHPYSRPIIGTVQSVKNHSRASIIKFFKKWYAPKNIVFIVIGDVEKNSIIELIEKNFKCKCLKNINSLKLIKPQKIVRPKAIEQNKPRFSVHYKNINEALVDIAFPVPNINHPDTASIDVLCAVLCQGDTSYLYHDIKFKKQLVNDISAYSYTPKDSGMILISVYLNPEKITIAIPEIIRKIVQFKYDPPGSNRMEKAKINILSDHIFQQETVDGQARKLGLYYLMSGKLDYEKIYHEAIENTTSDSILECSKKYILLGKINTVFLLPSQYEKRLPLEKLKKLVVPEFSDEERKQRSKKGKTSFKKTSSQSSLMSNVLIHTLSSGIKLVLKKNQFSPIVAMRAAMLGGVRFERSDTNGINALLARMFTMGTKTKSAMEISNIIESKATALSGYSGKNTFGLEGEFLSKYTDENLDLFAEVLLSPTFPKKEFENEQKNILEHIRVIKDNLASYVFQLFSQNMFMIHPYRFHLLGSPESVAGLTRRNLMSFYKTLINYDNLFVSVVGDIDPDHIITKMEKLLASVSKAKTIFPQIPKETKILTPKTFHYNIDKNQTHILYGFRGTTINNNDRYIMDIIQALLSGQSGRLFIKLRDQMSLAYSVFAASMEGLDPGYFAVYIACSPEKRELAIKHLKIELDRLKDKKISETELNNAKKYLIGRQDIGLQKNSSQAFSLVYDELYKLGTGNTAKYPEFISSITSSDIQNACIKYFDHNRSVLTSIGQ